MLRKTITDYKHGLLREVINEYVRAGHGLPATARQLACFAVERGLWRADTAKLVQACTRAISQALRQEKHTDAYGREVRTMHAARRSDVAEGSTERQLTLWDDIRTAPREHMEQSFAQRRDRLARGCYRLKTDVDSHNDMNLGKAAIQLVFTFVDDIAELEQPAAMPSADIKKAKPR